MARYTTRWSVPPSRPDGMAADLQSRIWSVCSVTVANRDLLASGSGDGTVWLWDPATGEPVTVLEGRSCVNALCPITVAGRHLLAAGDDDGTVRVWDPAAGESAAAYRDRTKGLSPRIPVARAGAEPVTVLRGRGYPVRSVCPVTVAGRDLLAAGGDDMTVRVLDPATREEVATLDRRAAGYWGGGFGSVCPVTVAGRNMLAAGDDDGTVQVWDPASAAGEQPTVLGRHQGGVRSVCPVTVSGRHLLASGSWDATLLVWDPAAATKVAALEDHQGGVRSVCPVAVAGQDLLASGGEDNTVRVWRPATGESSITIPVSHRVTAVHQVSTLLAIGHDFGIQVIELNLGT